MYQERYRVFTFDLSLASVQLLFNGTTFFPTMGVGTEIAGIIFTLSSGLTIQGRLTQTGDLYTITDGQTWSHVGVDSVTGCPGGETSGFCFLANAVAGIIEMRVTYGRDFGGAVAT